MIPILGNVGIAPTGLCDLLLRLLSSQLLLISELAQLQVGPDNLESCQWKKCFVFRIVMTYVICEGSPHRSSVV